MTTFRDMCVGAAIAIGVAVVGELDFREELRREAEAKAYQEAQFRRGCIMAGSYATYALDGTLICADMSPALSLGRPVRK
jgi:hypothetical protein